MKSLSVYVLDASILLQGMAAILALFIIPLSKRALAWILLSVAFIFMTLRRILSLLAEANVAVPQWILNIDPEWVALTISVMLVVGILRIRTIFIQRNQIEDALRESEERYALASQGSNDGLWDWNLKTDSVFYSERWKSMLGHTSLEVSSQPDEMFRRIHEEDLSQVKRAIDDHIANKASHFEIEHRMRHKDGHYLWVLNRGLAVRDETGNAKRIAGSISDISERKDFEQRLIHSALHDRLTRLPNRELFLQRLAKSIDHFKSKPGYSFAVLFIDLDRFKVLNDSHGHIVGDEMLLTVSRRIESCMRDTDLVARLGGDEFTVLLEPVSDLTQLVAIADRIQNTISQPMLLGDLKTYTTASIGIAPSLPSYQLPEHILRDADTAMYSAKAQGKARYQIFNPKMHDRAVKLMTLETDLRRAINQNEFIIHYQPIVTIDSERVVGVEALVRWQHPERGIVSPLTFIPLAEETGLIVPIGMEVLRKACQQIRLWKSSYPGTDIKVSVNISQKQISDDEFIEHIATLLQETGTHASNLRMEITESLLMENPERATVILNKIKSIGIALDMDDFGTGYSSLSYLHKFPIDRLKIDRSFIQGMTTDSDHQEIVKSIIDLAHSLKIDVTAEGIETLEQLNMLRAMGCNYAQGYYFAKPDTAEVISNFLYPPEK